MPPIPRGKRSRSCATEAVPVHVIPLLLLVLYVYANEIERRNWKVVFAGLALFGMDWFNEIWNALVFHFTQYAPSGAHPPIPPSCC